MKAAACWFARRWSVRTKALDENVERTVTFDVPEIISSGTEQIEPVEVRSDDTGQVRMAGEEAGTLGPPAAIQF